MHLGFCDTDASAASSVFVAEYDGLRSFTWRALSTRGTTSAYLAELSPQGDRAVVDDGYGKALVDLVADTHSVLPGGQWWWSEDGDALLRWSGTLHVHDPDGILQRSVPGTAPTSVYGDIFTSPDGSWVGAANTTTVAFASLYGTDSWSAWWSPSYDRWRGVAFDTTGSRVAYTDGVTAWSRPPGGGTEISLGPANWVMGSEDGTMLVLAQDNGAIVATDWLGNSRRTVASATGDLWSVVLGPTGSHLIYRDQVGTHLVSTNGGPITALSPATTGTIVASWSPSGNRVSYGGYLWEVANPVNPVPVPPGDRLWLDDHEMLGLDWQNGVYSVQLDGFPASNAATLIEQNWIPPRWLGWQGYTHNWWSDRVFVEWASPLRRAVLVRYVVGDGYSTMHRFDVYTWDPVARTLALAGEGGCAITPEPPRVHGGPRFY